MRDATRATFLRGYTSTVAGPYADHLDALMTTELIAETENQEDNDCLTPMHVHLLWIGDIDRAPKDHVKYTEMGYNLTVHTSAEENFYSYVLKAFKLAIPDVVGYDFLKFAMLYKYGGLSADTFPSIPASQLKFPSDCGVLFGKEYHLPSWEKPLYSNEGKTNYGLNRPFKVLNWAMVANKPRNRHVKWLMTTAMMHFFGRRDMEGKLIQDISGSGLMIDYVALLHERAGRDYLEVNRVTTEYVPVEGICLTDGLLTGDWIRHPFLNS